MKVIYRLFFLSGAGLKIAGVWGGGLSVWQMKTKCSCLKWYNSAFPLRQGVCKVLLVDFFKEVSLLEYIWVFLTLPHLTIFCIKLGDLASVKGCYKKGLRPAALVLGILLPGCWRPAWGPGITVFWYDPCPADFAKTSIFLLHTPLPISLAGPCCCLWALFGWVCASVLLASPLLPVMPLDNVLR